MIVEVNSSEPKIDGAHISRIIGQANDKITNLLIKHVRQSTRNKTATCAQV